MSSKTYGVTRKIEYQYRCVLVTRDEVYRGFVNWNKHFYNRCCTRASLGAKYPFECELHEMT